MKKIILALVMILTLPGSVFSNPFLGKWRVEVIGAEKSLSVVIDEEIFELIIGKNRQSGPYMIDAEKNIIEISILSPFADSFFYEIVDENTIDLYAYTNIKIDLKDVIMENLENSRGINSVTDDALDVMAEGVIKLMYEIPLIRFIREEAGIQ